jgi:hypothetical protein
MTDYASHVPDHRCPRHQGTGSKTLVLLNQEERKHT